MIADPRTSAAFSGHRTYRGDADAALRTTVRELYARGFRTFLCGMAAGFDLAAAEAVLACRGPVTAGQPSFAGDAAPAENPLFAAREASFACSTAATGDPAMPSAAEAAIPPVLVPPVISAAAMSPAPGPSAAPRAAVHAGANPPSGPLPGLTLVAVVPFAGQEGRFSAADRERFRRVLAAADRCVVLSPAYHTGCYAVRNNYLVEHASLLVAWYDGSPGGTHYTVRRALRRGLEFINLHRAAPALPQSVPTLF